ncbi:MAG TPA: nodulation protein NfeD [Bryobacterales bacterium]|nr:nodulation protein NfeD [Bryobacterales bacterium]
MPAAGLAVVLLFGAGGSAPRVLQVDIDAVIHPLTTEIVSRAIEQAAREGDAAVLITLNTPGGLMTAMQEIDQKIVASPVPVITYVAPSGGRAASAGFFILEAGDVAAMAPGTNTGASHPVMLGGGQMDTIMKQKIENDAAASLRTLAENRGRNSGLAQKAVLESKSFTEKEALDNHLIDLIAADARALLGELNGREIRRFDGRRQKLELAGAVIETFKLTPRERMLLPLVDPNVAFVLLVLGALGVYVEFTHPGLIFPGVAGGILVILAMMALTLLPINWAGAALIVLGLILFVLEAKIASHGILGIGGAVAMVMGAVILINSPAPEIRIHLLTALAVTLPFALITTFLLRLVIQARALKVATGAGGMIDEIGIAKTDLEPDGQVFVHGEWWNAVAVKPVRQGSKVKVLAVNGLQLKVAPSEDGGKETP